ncbi:unnamed protein product [Rotaria sordida]|uniref:Uncharacterized protein n=1 Tax=Rotaria sordida TaxID=392033 RepID=A0A819XHL3_9BILA|nr:unnamed protein product [Rotaria sordida]CAF4136354.1 unnamed protein product [Rotaria sordida]
MDKSWIDQYVPQFEYAIKTICLNEKSLNFVFTNERSFPNLQLINLQGNDWNMSLMCEKNSPSAVVSSSRSFLQRINYSDHTLPIYRRIPIDYDSDTYWANLSCQFIQRLSINRCSIEDIFIISRLAPNLIHLNIDYLLSGWNIDYYLNELNYTERTSHLVNLAIKTEQNIVFNQLEKVINSFKTSLKKLKLDVKCFDRIDGHRLEELFKSCEKLNKLAFFFECNRNSIAFNINDFQHSFQSEWWLDKCRPSVYIQHNDIDGYEDLSFIRFPTINQIHFVNGSHRSISLEDLYFIDRVFTSPNQSLCFNYCDLKSVDILFYMLMDDPSMTPALPNVNHFIIGSKTRLDSLTLCVWILLAVNLIRLDISNLTTFNKMELAEELRNMMNDDTRLKPKFDRIKVLYIFTRYDDDDDIQTKNDLVIAFQKVYSNNFHMLFNFLNTVSISQE